MLFYCLDIILNNLKSNNTYIRDMSKAWESALAQGTASGYAATEKDRFINDMLIPYLQKYPDLIKKGKTYRTRMGV